MKKFYAIAAAAFMAAGAMAQDGAPLYITGGAIDETEGAVSPWGVSNWNPEDPAELTFADGKYTGEFKGITMFKISTAKGSWDAFNGGAYGCNYGDEPGKAVELEAGYSKNIVCPWPGDYKIEVAGDLKTITLTTETPNPNPSGGATEVFLRGEMNGWGSPEEWKMTYVDGTYYFNCTGEQVILAGQTFKIADAAWTKVNYGVEEGAVVIQDDAAIWVSDGKDAKFEADWKGGVKFTIQEDGTALAEFSSTAVEIPESGIADVVVSDEAPVYFNLQGVRVANAENGLYIVKQGSKVSKVLVK